MKTVHYLHFRKCDEGTIIGKAGGLPTVLPFKKPWPPEDDDYLAFVLELRVDGEILKIPGASFIQLYQPIDEGDDPLPFVVVIKSDEARDGLSVNKHPAVADWLIEAVRETEPSMLPSPSPTPEYGKFLKSKLGGNDPWRQDDSKIFLGQISEMPGGFNFGGMTCSLLLQNDGSVVAELH